MAHSRLPQQVDVRAEHGVQIEIDMDRRVAYLHVDGYTACRVNFKGAEKDPPIELTIKNYHELPRVELKGDITTFRNL